MGTNQIGFKLPETPTRKLLELSKVERLTVRDLEVFVQAVLAFGAKGGLK